jgi:hypothetical protein
MQDIFEEIGFLVNIHIIMREGASDEKRMMLDAIERRINRKLALVDDFEALQEEDGA